eukprot:jgi/Chrpa1/13273/Chrysochromulina_OHIO_Genome00004657-RA
MDAITAPTHLLDLTMELLPLTFVGLTHADLARVARLRLSGLVGLTDTCVSSALTPALTHLPRLSVLDLSSTAVGTLGVLSLRTLARLEELHLVYCALVSYAAVLCLRTACPRLRLIRRLP